MRSTRFTLELDSPLGTARAEVLERRGWVVGLDPEAHDVPARGVGEATPLPGWTESHEDCRAALAAFDDRETPSGDERGGGSDDRTNDPDLTTPAARHGITLARADAAARADDRSLAALLADRVGFPEPAVHVPVNATIGDGTPAAAAREARRAVDDDYRAIKLKVGAGALDRDLDRMRAVQREVGPAIELRADANGAWDRTTARQALDKLRRMGVSYVEQPLPAADLRGHQALREELRIDLALDESIAEYGIERILAEEAADVVICKPMVLGGVVRTLEAARAAREAGVEPVVTTTIDAAIARTAAVHVAAAIPDVRPCGLATGSLLREDLVPDPAPVDDGRIEVPTDPGIAGSTFDEIVFEE
ncbi:enolase C-terminal domain-like protein [Halopenitus sp. H-Gu1]|uniref:enolase C-terminal domain-like protein n=1 Tax=Halopenitus sp. H-Gu1 TaxID=3242697 RepID=UPI00359E7B37